MELVKEFNFFSDISSKEDKKNSSVNFKNLSDTDSSTSYAEAAGNKPWKVVINKEYLDKLDKGLKIDGTGGGVQDDEEKMLEIEKRKLIYKTYYLKNRKIMQADSKEIEEWLRPFFNEITFLERGKRYGTFEVRFGKPEQAMKESTEKRWMGLYTLIHGEKSLESYH